MSLGRRAESYGGYYGDARKSLLHYQMMRNVDGSRFEDVSAALGSGFNVEAVSRGTAVVDYDNDGDLDILVTNIQAPVTLLRNDGAAIGHWLLVELTGLIHRDAIAARVTVTDGVTRQVRERQSGGNYLSSHDPRLHFRLGTARFVDIEIIWPDGEPQLIENVPADQILRVVQGLRDG